MAWRGGGVGRRSSAPGACFLSPPPPPPSPPTPHNVRRRARHHAALLPPDHHARGRVFVAHNVARGRAAGRQRLQAYRQRHDRWPRGARFEGLRRVDLGHQVGLGVDTAGLGSGRSHSGARRGRRFQLGQLGRGRALCVDALEQGSLSGFNFGVLHVHQRVQGGVFGGDDGCGQGLWRRGRERRGAQGGGRQRRRKVPPRACHRKVGEPEGDRPHTTTLCVWRNAATHVSGSAPRPTPCRWRSHRFVLTLLPNNGNAMAAWSCRGEGSAVVSTPKTGQASPSHGNAPLIVWSLQTMFG